jgi:hypothetical protein
MEICSRDYRDMFKRYAAELTVKQLIESHKLKHPNERKSRHGTGTELTEEQLETKAKMTEVILQKYGKNSVQVICEVSSVPCVFAAVKVFTRRRYKGVKTWKVNHGRSWSQSGFNSN